MNTGDILLDTNGNRILDSSGNVMLDDGAGQHLLLRQRQQGRVNRHHATAGSLARWPAPIMLRRLISHRVQCDTPCQVSGEVWDGALTNGGGATCQWINSHTCDTTSDGLQLNAFLTLISTEGSTCFWRLEVYCLQAGSNVLIWRGEKHTAQLRRGFIRKWRLMAVPMGRPA